MNKKFFSTLNKITDYIKKLDKKKRNMYLIILGVSVLVTSIAVFVLNHKDYVVLYRNLDTKECATIVGRLDEMKVPYKLENERTIYIEKSSEAKIKLQLASEGYPKSALNYDIFTKNIDFMTTDYEKTKYNLFLLQERLQSSIKTLDSVKDAIVTISLPDNSLAVLDKDKIAPSASVVLSLINGVVLNEQQIRGIEQLVAKSVPGLTVRNVSIIDQSGKILNDHSDDEVSATTSNKVKTENEVSAMISKRISSVLEPLYGKSNISIGVNVSLDYSKKTTEKTVYSPVTGNNGIVDDFQQSFVGPGSGTGTAAGVPGTDSNSEIPIYQTQAGNANQNIKSDVSVKYFVNQMREQVQKDGAEIKDITVSVLINKKDMSPEETASIIKVIANTSGIASDKVELLSAEFTASNNKVTITAETKKPAALLSEMYIIILIVIVVLLIAAIILIKAKFKRKKKEMLKEMFADEQTPPKKDFVNELSKMSETKEQQLTREIREFSMKSPHITAQLIKTMLKGDMD